MARAWAVLRPPRTTELASYPVAALSDGSECRVALDRDGLRHLLVPAPAESLTHESPPSVLSCVVRSLRFNAEPVVHVDIRCSDRDLDEEFDELIDDLLTEIKGATAPGAAALASLERWRRLFRSRLMRGLSGRARIGLFAELTVLLALIHADPDLTVEVWTGPLDAPHDFETPGRCLEVKAASGDPGPVIINGLGQLDTHDDRDLDLLVITVAPDPDGTTLTELIGTIRHALSDPAVLDERLRRLRWQSDPLVSDTERFVAGGLLRVPITDATPRLVAASLITGGLPVGMGGVSYRVDLAALMPHSAPGSLSEIAAAAVMGGTP